MTATGRLADPTDLTFDDAHLTDAETHTTAIDDLLARKPHLSTEHELSGIARELRKIREALERMSPPLPKVPRESAYERHGIMFD